MIELKKMIRFECSRAFSTLGFKLALLIGALIAVSHFVMNVVPYVLRLEEYIEINKPMSYPGWLYSLWLGGNSYTVQSFLFFMILPLLAALPFADSFYSDATGGYVAEVFTRIDRSRYFVGKYVAVFFSGAIAVLFPLVLNFLLSFSILPALKPEPTDFGSPITADVSMSELYFNKPVLFLLVHLLIIFIIGGLFAVFALSASYFCNYQFLALISPFLLYISLVAIFGFLDLEDWQPNNFLNPAYRLHTISPVFATGFLLILLSTFFFIRGKRADVF